ncbi:MAG: hypothetical protein Q4P71_06280 [Actinomycetaceae bacterium]|nr:hypothetical protein [Actinomycetaceae bacterium]
MSWWKRNWRWLIVLPIAVVAAGFASSHRLLEIYWPSDPTSEVAVESETAHYTSSLTNAGVTYERAIDVTFDGAQIVESVEGLTAVEGARLWAFDFTMAADPEVIADGCTVIALDSDGRQYFPRAATRQDVSAGALVDSCVPFGAEGPTIDYFSGELIDSATPRPAQWTTTSVIAIPDGVEPRTVRIYWDLPRYADFPVR